MTKLELFEELFKVTTYDEKTGKVYWSVGGRGRILGRILGKEIGTENNGYRTVQFLYKVLRVHQYIWWLETGEVVDIVDHINHETSNNTLLRSCTPQQNMFNKRIYKSNKLGYKGVVAHQGKFRAVIRKDGKQHHIGSYNTPEEASDAYYNKAKELFGEFACRG